MTTLADRLLNKWIFEVWIGETVFHNAMLEFQPLAAVQEDHRHGDQLNDQQTEKNCDCQTGRTRLWQGTPRVLFDWGQLIEH
ncbi:MAG: hypothetical protein MJH08_13920 [Hyphomicrobiales bacterium]|nr:hypothetical protein [Hyphomicrobiales bacterium]